MKSTQKIIEILENKGFSMEEDPEEYGTILCRKRGYREIKFREKNEGHLFKVLNKYTSSLEKALEIALVEEAA